MTLNLPLAARFAIKNLSHHPVVSAGTVLGVAIGMTVVTAVLIVDNNTALTPQQQAQLDELANRVFENAVQTSTTDAGPGVWSIRSIQPVRQDARNSSEANGPSVVPSQEGEAEGPADPTAAPRGEADYQAMRLAVRLASLLAFSIGAVIVFYTMRFSVASRSRAFGLLLCLGESRSNIRLSLLVEALMLGSAGTAAGLLGGVPIARFLLERGISTTGRVPMGGFDMPVQELLVMALIGILVALLGIAGPVRSLNRINIASVLQPRFLSEDVRRKDRSTGFAWAIPPLLAATYVAVRPFLESWLSVIQFFLLEATVVVGITVMTLWWIQPLLRLALRILEAAFRPVFPLETKLTGQRMRLTSKKIASSVIGITLVFSMLAALEDITGALKAEIDVWARDALLPYAYFERNTSAIFDFEGFETRARQAGLDVFPMSARGPASLPIRLVRTEDANAYLERNGRPPLTPGTVILSRSLASQFGVVAGDALVLGSAEDTYEFEIIEVADDLGFFPNTSQTYIDAKSYAVFGDDNPLFADNLARTVGQFNAVRFPTVATARQWRDLITSDDRQFLRFGANERSGRTRGIDRDFLIFDFVMFMTIVLAAVGVTNALLIQVHVRGREFSVLSSIGVSRLQIVKLLLMEGVLIGLVSATLALVQGHLLGMISVAFLDRFTLFDYHFVFSVTATAWIFALAVGTCCIAAAYPALVATRPPAGEALHYE